MKRLVVGLAAAVLCCTANAQEVTLRHALQGRALEALTNLTERFNQAQKGKAKVVLQDAAEVRDASALPQMALLDADDSASFFGSRPRFKPLAQAMAEAREKLDGKRFYPVVAATVSDGTGRLQALPLGMNLPVLMWNRDMFKQAGLDPDQPPKTWWEVQRVAGELIDHGNRCPLTTSRFAWVHLENLSSQHNAPIVAANRVTLNTLVDVKHIALLSSWVKSSYFRYYGPRQEGDKHFLSGECAMLTGESSLYAEALAAGLPVGLAELPHYDDVYGATPKNILPEGAALWLLDGAKKEETRVAARFVSFLMQPQSQREWVKATAYLPMTADGLKALRDSAAPRVLVEAAESRLAGGKTMARFNLDDGNPSVRDILDDEIETVWRNEKPAKAALDDAMQRVNAGRAPAAKLR